MASSEVVGSLAGLWRFPVKSMSREQLEQAELTERGLLGERAFALIDMDTGKVVSAKSVRLFPDLLGCQAEFAEPPQAGRELPPVRIVLPDGTSVMSGSSDVDRCCPRASNGASLLPAPRRMTSPSTSTLRTSRI